MENHVISNLPPGDILPRRRAWRMHPKHQVELARGSIRRFGIPQPVLIDGEKRIVCGALIVEAAIQERLPCIPVVRVDHLTNDELRLYAIAANKLADQAGYDVELLGEELQELQQLLEESDLAITGIAQAELDRLLKLSVLVEDDNFPVDLSRTIPVSRPGDLWRILDHRLLHADALVSTSYQALMANEKAAFILSDVPYNLEASAISGNGKHKHGNFIQAAGELSPNEFTRFLTTAMRLMKGHSVDGSLHAFFMSYHFLLELLRAGNVVYGRPKAMCTWVKKAGGLGSLYRSQTEFITFFKNGRKPHQNHVMMGAHGRTRTSAWFYDGMNSFSAERDALLAIHATPKPVALLQDAILDVTRGGDIVLDPFGGSGSLLLAAHACGRRARLMELDGVYVDASLRRIASALAVDPVREADGRLFSELTAAAEDAQVVQ